MDVKNKLLFIDDDDEMRALLKRFFVKNGFEFLELQNADNLLFKLANFKPTLVIMDIMLPGVTGIEALRELRKSGHDIPVILLSAKNEPIDKVIGLEAGADDYIGKPFLPHELLARINAVLRRYTRTELRCEQPIIFGPFSLNLAEKSLCQGRQVIKLSSAEFGILSSLAAHLNQVVSRFDLITSVYGSLSDISERAIDVLIWRIRQVIELNPSQPMYLKTIRGEGYMLCGDVVYEKYQC